MNIPARIVVEKMEEELIKLKATLEDESSSAYRDQAMAIKTYCELLLSSSQSAGTTAPKVKHATVEDVTGKKSRSITDEIERLTVYDEDEKPESDSLLDF
ncbi:hypothetical protein J2S74_004872 [Evansella vedderi]|uniref:YwdI family protein n=1 Tax=Evansella vedderi TaxID=38282 RepID=A0ABU0A1R2_9BACI|nr:YwdI family protein [Evansella vedderi]MDQ0257414.1 hypothetical protein [Evansella vedderi]